MHTNEGYEAFRLLASPVVALTTAWQGRSNGMISDSAMRASISPKVPRVSVYVHKWHFSHDLIWQSGGFVMHLLRQDQLDLVHRLGFVSGRDRDKLAEVPHRSGVTGMPVLEDCYAAFECRVVNTMDTGYSTHFLGDVLETHLKAKGPVLTAAHFRAHMPQAWQEAWMQNYRRAQEEIERGAEIKDIRWERARTGK